jgi:hypothetical protein
MTKSGVRRGGKYVVYGPNGIWFGTYSTLREARKCYSSSEDAAKIMWYGRRGGFAAQDCIALRAWEEKS